MKIFAKMMVAAIVAVGMACVLIMHDASGNDVIVTMFATAIAVSGLLGVFGESAKSRHTSLKDGARSYDQAA